LTTTYDVNAEALERQAGADRLADQQSLILSVTRLLNRVEVRGGAGSGKTVLALQQAKELTRGRHERKAQRIALLCYSIGLAEHLKRQVASWPRKDRPAFVGTFQELAAEWGVTDFGDRTASTFWEEELPQRMAELAQQLPDGKLFEAVVVDEAQDFADSWWTPVLGALRDEADGGLYVFSDEDQRIFGRFGRPPFRWCRWSWTTACATPRRSPRLSRRSRRRGCTPAAATGPRSSSCPRRSTTPSTSPTRQ